MNVPVPGLAKVACVPATGMDFVITLSDAVPMDTPTWSCISVVCMIHTMISADVIRRLRPEGWELHHVKGSHHQFRHPERQGKITVPHPKRDLPEGTLRSIFRQAGWKWGT
jgi:predicted RNA binding protein YcfA (HicA-like mRNA interferase family)